MISNCRLTLQINSLVESPQPWCVVMHNCFTQSRDRISINNNRNPELRQTWSCTPALLLLLLLLLLSVCWEDWVSWSSDKLLQTFPLTAHTICMLRKSLLWTGWSVAVSTVTHGAALQRESAQTHAHHMHHSLSLSQHWSLCSPRSYSHRSRWEAHTLSLRRVCVYVGYRGGGEREGGEREGESVCVSEREHVWGSLKRRALTEQCNWLSLVFQITHKQLAVFFLTPTLLCSTLLTTLTGRKWPNSATDHVLNFPYMLCE